MIGMLRGRLRIKQPPRVMLDVNGVGYELDVPMSTFWELPAVGETLELLTHLIVREDAHALYGFVSEQERRLFRDLLKVSGVGARVALAVLSGISVQGFARCIEEADVPSLVRVPGIGKKTAERLIVEMRDRIREHDLVEGKTPGHTQGEAGAPEAEREAYSALMALGYKAAEARRMLGQIETAGRETAEIVREALRGPGQGPGTTP